jgi:hypothetical protein
MKKPLHGEYLNVRYEGAMLRLRCDDVTETPNRGPGCVSFTVISDSQFQRGHPAYLILGADEISIDIERVTVVGNRRRNIVLFRGVFEAPQPQHDAVSVGQA